MTSATHLRCRVCEHESPLLGAGECPRCGGTLDVVYDWPAVARQATKKKIASGPRSLWRYAPFLPVEPPPNDARQPGWTPLVRAPRLAETLGVGKLYLKLEQLNPSGSFCDRMIATAATKAAQLGVRKLACTSTGALGRALIVGGTSVGSVTLTGCTAAQGAATISSPATSGARIADLSGWRRQRRSLFRALFTPEDRCFVDDTMRPYLVEGAKTVAFEIAEQLDRRFPDAIVAPVITGTLATRLWQGFDQLARVGLVPGRLPLIIAGQPVAPPPPRTSERELALASVRTSGGAAYPVPAREIEPNLELLARACGIEAEAPTGLAVSTLRAAAADGSLADAAVVLVVTSAPPTASISTNVLAA
jgi:threonine synthase